MPLSKVRAAADGRLTLAPQRPVHAVRAVRIEAAGRTITCRLYHPTQTDNLPVVLFFHGGGWVWGNLDSHDSVCRSLAIDTGCAVLAVDYRLAPEHPFPAALDDARDALAWLRENGATLGLDPTCIALCGDSSGANIALHTAARTSGPLQHLGLFYPPLDPSCASASQQTYADNHLLTREAMLWFWKNYLDGQTFDLGTLSGLPPTSIGLAQYDILHDEGRAFSSGGDIPWMQEMIDTGFAQTSREAKRIIAALLDCEKPVIAKLNGHATGFGATLALFCDVIFASDHAKIGDPHVSVGLTAGDGGAVIWPQLIGYARAKEYLMTGDLIPAPEAVRIGLINHAFAAADLDERVDAFADRLASGATTAIRTTKMSINIGLKQLFATIMDACLAMESASNGTADHQEAVNAFGEGRSPEFGADRGS